MNPDPVTVAEQKRRDPAAVLRRQLNYQNDQLARVCAEKEIMLRNLTATQERCNELVTENRRLSRAFDASEAAQKRMRDLQWRVVNEALGHSEPIDWDDAMAEIMVLVAGNRELEDE